MEDIICSDCKEKQWSVNDCNYVKEFNTCWSCDRQRWTKKKLSLKDFESRENKIGYLSYEKNN